TVSGARQLTVAPDLSALSLNFESGFPSLAAPLVSQDIVFQAGASPTAAPAFTSDPTFAIVSAGSAASATEANDPTIYLSPDLVGAEGIGNVTLVTTNGDISVLSPLEGQRQGSISLTGKNVDLEADITLPGGQLSATAAGFDPTVPTSSFSFA